MDKSFDDSMAPALHTSNHDNNSAAIKYLQLPPNSPQTNITENNTIYEQMNGGHSIDDAESAAKLIRQDENELQPMKECTNHVNTIDNKVVQSNRLLELPPNGGSGDYVSSITILQQDLKKAIQSKSTKKLVTSEEVNGSGDSAHEVHKSNGWRSDHQVDSDKFHTGQTSPTTGQPIPETTSTKTDFNTDSLKAVCHKPLTASLITNCHKSEEVDKKSLENQDNMENKHLEDLDRIQMDINLNSTLCETKSSTQPLSVISSTSTTDIVDTNLSSTSGRLLPTVSNEPLVSQCQEQTNVTTASGTVLDVMGVLSDICDSVVRINSDSSGTAASRDGLCNSAYVAELEALNIKETCLTDPDSMVSSNLNSVPGMQGLAQSLITGNHMQNLPLKLTNTLHELAASLTRAQGLPIDNSAQKGSVKSKRRSSSSAKSLNFEETEEVSVSRISNLDKIHATQTQQFKEVLRRYTTQKHDLTVLQTRLNKIRCAAVNVKVRNQLQEVATCCDSKATETSDSKTNKNTKPGQLSDQARFFWRAKLQRRKHHRKYSFDGLDGHAKPGNDHVDSLNTHLDKSEQMCHKTAESQSGLLRKEVRFVQSSFDPELTDSSSDEDIPERVYKSGEGYIPSRKTLKHKSTQHHQPDQHKRRSPSAQQVWLQQRLSVAKRWTWLQAQVSDLEFKIRSHNELYRQLRSSKGEVLLGHQQVSTSFVEGNQEASTLESNHTPLKLTSATSSPCSVSKMVQNINKQTTNLLDNLSPVSVSAQSPMPSTETFSRSQTDSMPVCSLPVDSTCVAARTRPLSQSVKSRPLVKARDILLASSKSLAPSTVGNDSRLMGHDFVRRTPFHRGDGKPLEIAQDSIQSKAAIHDHSYHKMLSTEEDIPLSLRLGSFMKSSHKWYNEKMTKRERRHEKKNKRKNSKNKAESLAEKIKTRSRSATVVLERIKSVNSMQRLSSGDSFTADSHKRRGSIQTMADYHKRQRMNSVDSDLENFQLRSGANTPTQDTHSNLQVQAFLKRKRQTDQAYDINNIVIPHGLTTTRIEKLQYKEILTPGWRPAADEKQQADSSGKANSDVEELTDAEFRVRHDHYEIMEKKKYMAYMEWSMNKKNGTRSMSRANMLSDAAHSFHFPPSIRSSPLTHVTSPDPSSPGSPELNPSMIAGIRTRRTSSDQFRPPSFDSTTTSPSAIVTPRERHASSADEGASSSRQSGEWHPIWEPRNFPLNDVDYEELMKKPVVPDVQPPRPQHDGESPETRFRPISHHSSVDTNTAPRHRGSSKHESGSTRKRPRTSSLLSRDEERYSDESVSSSHSYRRQAHPQTRKDELHIAGSNPTPVAAALPKRHKPNLKDDFYFYSDLDSDIGSETESVASDDEDAVLISDGEMPSQWTGCPVVLPSLGPKDHQDNVKVPLVMTFRRK
uniref:KAT8 regulatory NSL complex subunit 1-like n=1 Tax=Phallusia mammillata TaxID=59560 RepID=A0A6F9DFI4_9ASCI|nr:KAT8 regulatory NSL complex subunit 1-like [Phallusia mammillata]